MADGRRVGHGLAKCNPYRSLSPPLPVHMICWTSLSVLKEPILSLPSLCCFCTSSLSLCFYLHAIHPLYNTLGSKAAVHYNLVHLARLNNRGQNKSVRVNVKSWWHLTSPGKRLPLRASKCFCEHVSVSREPQNNDSMITLRCLQFLHNHFVREKCFVLFYCRLVGCSLFNKVRI